MTTLCWYAAVTTLMQDPELKPYLLKKAEHPSMQRACMDSLFLTKTCVSDGHQVYAHNFASVVYN